MSPDREVCDRHIERTQTLETSVAVLSDRLDDMKSIRNSVAGIENHLARHSEAMPRIENAVLQLTKTYYTEHRKLEDRVGGVEISLVSHTGKSRIIFAILGTIGISALAAVFKLII